MPNPDDILTSGEAALLYGLHRDTTLKAAKGHRGNPGVVTGAYHEKEPRAGSLKCAWVATRAAWEEWNRTRKPGRKPSTKTPHPAGLPTREG